MTPEQSQPLPEEPEASSEAQDEEYTPLTPEDFGPGEEWFRDTFFAFRKELEENGAAYIAAEEAKLAVKTKAAAPIQDQ